MKLDRNVARTPRRGKYALIKLRETNLTAAYVNVCEQHNNIAEVMASAIDFGDTYDSDFFVIRLKDKYAAKALTSYAEAAETDGELEYAKEVYELAKLAANHPNQTKPT